MYIFIKLYAVVISNSVLQVRLLYVYQIWYKYFYIIVFNILYSVQNIKYFKWNIAQNREILNIILLNAIIID